VEARWRVELSAAEKVMELREKIRAGLAAAEPVEAPEGEPTEPAEPAEGALQPHPGASEGGEDQRAPSEHEDRRAPGDPAPHAGATLCGETAVSPSEASPWALRLGHIVDRPEVSPYKVPLLGPRWDISSTDLRSLPTKSRSRPWHGRG